MPRVAGDAAQELDWKQLHSRAVPKNNDAYDQMYFQSRRSTVFSTKGMCASTQTLASECGLEILRKGGNAADAAVAVAAALNVTEPANTGIGGDAFALYWDAKTKKMSGINGSGRSPKALTLAKARELGFDETFDHLPQTSIHSVTVPGTAACWVDTIKEHGSGKVTLAEILEPAARLAEEGFPVSEISARLWNRAAFQLRDHSPNGHEMMLPDGKGGFRPPLAGEIFQNANLAKTFRKVGKEGRDGFYKGEVAKAIVEVSDSLGGTMTLEDLASHTTTHVDPISYTYQDEVTLHEIPPNGQGLAALIALGIIDVLTSQGKISLETMEHNSAQYLHVLIEVIRLAFADARAFVADPEHAREVSKELLSKEYLESRAALFDPKQAAPEHIQGQPIRSSDTVYLATADADGNTCSFIQSNFAGFGHGSIPKGTGFTLQCRGSGFSLREGHVNTLAGGKRPYHTIIPAMATRKGEHYLTFGVMGGFMQPQGHIQVLMNVLHRAFTLQTAIDAPRFCIGAGMPSTSGKGEAAPSDIVKINNEVNIEEGIDPKVVDELYSLGHKATLVKGAGRGLFGRGQIIMSVHDERTGKRVWAGASDPRGDGCAAPQL